MTSKNVDFGEDNYKRRKPDIVDSFPVYKARPDMEVSLGRDVQG